MPVKISLLGFAHLHQKGGVIQKIYPLDDRKADCEKTIALVTKRDVVTIDSDGVAVSLWFEPRTYLPRRGYKDVGDAGMWNAMTWYDYMRTDVLWLSCAFVAQKTLRAGNEAIEERVREYAVAETNRRQKEVELWKQTQFWN